MLENNRYQIRYNSFDIKAELENLCNQGVSVCNDKFIGPIKNGINLNSTSEEILFFISFDKQSILYNKTIKL